MEQLPRGEEVPEALEKEHSARQELLARADESVAQELRELSASVEAESDALAHFELNGREWKIEDEDDREFAKELVLLEKVQDVAEREIDYYKKKGLLKIIERQKVYIEMLRRTIELRREWPSVAEQVTSGDHNNE